MKHLLLTTIAAMVLVGCGPPDRALIQAARTGNHEAVKQHLASGADVNATDMIGRTPLHYAATKEITELLIANGADVNAKDDDLEFTPLHLAAEYGHKEIAESLIAKGADVNAKNVWGGTPLHYAADHGQTEIVELLIAKGADVNEKHYWLGLTPLDQAKRHPETAALLRKHGGKTGAELPSLSLLEALRRGDLQRVKDFLANGADVNAKRGDFTTPLHLAAQGGHKEIAELLIAAGADVNAKNRWGTTPLHYAAEEGLNTPYEEEGHKEIAELLIANGVDVNAKKNNGRTPLDLAESGFHVRIVEYPLVTAHNEIADLLRKHGGKTGEELRTGITPLQQAARDGHKEIAELLIAEGADVNAKDDDGWTPLHWAASRGHKEIVELLIAKGANVNTRTRKGRGITPLDMANDRNPSVQKGHRETADILRKHGGKTTKELEAAGN